MLNNSAGKQGERPFTKRIREEEMELNRERVFLISLDGATFDVLKPLVQQGYMPNVGAMMRHGIGAELESVVPPVTAPAWSSFMTGKHPGKHGVLDFTRFKSDDYTWSINNAQHIQGKTVWQLLSEQGKRVVVLNLPYTYPPPNIDGIVVSGWDAPPTAAVFSHPAEISERILQTFPDYKANLWVSDLQPLRSHSQLSDFVGKLKAGFEQQTTIAVELLEQERWDVFMVHFQQTDWIQHKLWDYIERACSNPDDHSDNIEATRDCYRRFDEMVGILLEKVAPLGVTKILISDHGFGRLMGNVYPNYYLKEWGYLSLKDLANDSFAPVKNLLRKSRNSKIRKLYRNLAELKNRLLASTEQQHQSWTDNASDVLGSRGKTWDWSKTRAAVVYAYQMGFVFVNKVGSGPFGVVNPGTEYESLIEDLRSRFRELRHAYTGEKLLQDVVKGTDVYPGCEPSSIPDLVLVPVDGYGFSFSIADNPPEASQEGTHRHNGILLLQGNSVRHPGPQFRPRLVDIAPTILHLLGLPVPSDMDGVVLEEILADNQEIRYAEPDRTSIQVTSSYDAEESGLIAQRLKGLGYIE